MHYGTPIYQQYLDRIAKGEDIGVQTYVSDTSDRYRNASSIFIQTTYKQSTPDQRRGLGKHSIVTLLLLHRVYDV